MKIWDKIKETFKRETKETKDRKPPGVKIITPPRKESDDPGPKGTKLVLQPCTSQLPVA